MQSAKNKTLSGTIDFHLQQIARGWQEAHMQSGTSQITVRISNDLKAKLDVVSSALDMTRSALIAELLDAAVEETIDRYDNNPYLLDENESLRQRVEDEIGAATAGYVFGSKEYVGKQE